MVYSIMFNSLGTNLQLCVCVSFFSNQTYLAPPPPQQTTLDACVSIFPCFNNLKGRGRGRSARTLIILPNSGIRYLYPLVLLVLLISLNLTYSNAIRLLLVQTMTSLTLTPGSRSAANAVGHVIFY